MMENTLTGDYWYCFRQSSSDVPGMLIFVGFMVIVVIMLLNTLIAMMAETYTINAPLSFQNYAFSFGKVLVSYRCKPGSTAVPLNLLLFPYYLLSLIVVVYSILRRNLFGNGAQSAVRHSWRFNLFGTAGKRPVRTCACGCV